MSNEKSLNFSEEFQQELQQELQQEFREELDNYFPSVITKIICNYLWTDRFLQLFNKLYFENKRDDLL